MPTARILRNRKQRPEPRHRPADPVRRRPLPVADLLDLRRRAPADRRPDAGRLRDGGVAVPVRRHDRLHDPAPARVPRGRARARAGDAGRRGAAARARLRACARTATTAIERDFLRCPSCLRKLKERCVSCSRPLDQAWTICPYCETEVAGAIAAPRRARRRRRQRPPSRARRAGDRDEPARRGRAPRPTRERREPEGGERRRGGAERRRRRARAARRRRPPRSRAAPAAPVARARAARAAARVRASSPTTSTAKEPMDRTLILVKPDAFARGLTGEIIARFERKGLRIVALRHMTVTRELAERHYAEHAERPVLRRARRLHHLRPARRDGARGRRAPSRPRAR